MNKPKFSVVLIAKNVSPYILAYPWSAGFGTKYADPATLPTGGASVPDIKFSPHYIRPPKGDFLACM